MCLTKRWLRTFVRLLSGVCIFFGNPLLLCLPRLHLAWPFLSSQTFLITRLLTSLAPDGDIIKDKAFLIPKHAYLHKWQHCRRAASSDGSSADLAPLDLNSTPLKYEVSLCVLVGTYLEYLKPYVADSCLQYLSAWSSPGLLHAFCL